MMTEEQATRRLERVEADARRWLEEREATPLPSDAEHTEEDRWSESWYAGAIEAMRSILERPATGEDAAMIRRLRGLQ
jgi:hypothetical protein